MNEIEQERNEEYYLGGGEVCDQCGRILKYQAISSDADGNRIEYADVCEYCD